MPIRCQPDGQNEPDVLPPHCQSETAELLDNATVAKKVYIGIAFYKVFFFLLYNN